MMLWFTGGCGDTDLAESDFTEGNKANEETSGQDGFSQERAEKIRADSVDARIATPAHELAHEKSRVRLNPKHHQNLILKFSVFCRFQTTG